mmetsp:Transcript_76316/g.196501  ORF Transcript_76316/g.196501 Transcript_76316/m.196501 type:complete len:227 (-) Transcript_76316:580-1260(-)
MRPVLPVHPHALHWVHHHQSAPAPTAHWADLDDPGQQPGRGVFELVVLPLQRGPGTLSGHDGRVHLVLFCDAASELDCVRPPSVWRGGRHPVEVADGEPGGCPDGDHHRNLRQHALPQDEACHELPGERERHIHDSPDRVHVAQEASGERCDGGHASVGEGVVVLRRDRRTLCGISLCKLARELLQLPPPHAARAHGNHHRGQLSERWYCVRCRALGLLRQPAGDV